MDLSPEPDLLALVAARYAGQDDEARRLEEAARRRLEYRKAHAGKRCDRCRETKPVSAFGVDRSRKDGLRRYCRSCVSGINARRGPRTV